MSGNVADFSGDIPRHYDRDLGPIIFADYAADMARRVVSGAAPARVLETAAGTGIVSRALRDALPATAHLTATDLNPAMLEIARAKFASHEQVSLQPADATALPFADGAFDTVVCQFGIMFFPDKQLGLREAHRVLAARGRALFSVWDAHRHNAFGQIVHDVVSGFFPVDPPRFYEVPFGYSQIDPIKDALLAVGFGRIDVTILPKQRMVEDFSAFARGLIFGNPIYDQIRQRGGVEPAEVQAAVATAMRQKAGGEPGQIMMQAIVFEAHKA